jgi:hypothetical protein
MEDQTKIHENPFPAWSAASFDTWLVPLALLLGLALRLYDAATIHFNPDECMHVYYAWPADWAVKTLAFHHPPLLFFLIHHLQALNHSEIFLRLPSVLAGVLFPWVFLKWLQQLQVPVAATGAFLLLEFSPNLIALSSQVRGYTLMLLFLASALYFLEIALQRRSLPLLLPFAASLYLAIFTEFSAAFATAGFGIYALLRFFSTPRPWAFSATWAATQLGGLALYAYLYKTLAADLLTSPTAKRLIAGYLADCFPRPGQNLLFFSLSATFDQFAYPASSKPMGLLLAALFLLGLFALWTTQPSTSRTAPNRALLFSVLASLAVALIASLALVHPYGRSRHSIVLALFTALPAALGLQWIFHRFSRLKPHAGPILLASTALLYAFSTPDVGNISSSRNSISAMHQAMEAIQAEIPKGAILLSDQETAWTLAYYLERKLLLMDNQEASGLRRHPFTSYRAYSLRWDLVSYEQIAEDKATLRRLENIPSTEPIYVLDSGFTMLPFLTLNARDLSAAMILVRPESM